MRDSKQPDNLDRRIDQALRRGFAVPTSLDTLAARARPGRRRGPWLSLVLALAAGVVLLLWVTRKDEGHAPLGIESARLEPPLGELFVSDAPFCRLIGPLAEEPEPGLTQRPNLERLYRDMDACQRESSAASCGDGDFLAERMSATYGAPLGLRPEAEGLLQGPFGSDEWPTGTIVTGTKGALTSVLVADLDETLSCCVRMKLPEDSGLRMFTWRVGDVVLTEISPFEEPHLLTYFE